MTLFHWPDAAAFGRVIPKNRIYQHASASTALRKHFIDDVERITWAFKLAPETVNLPASPELPEIQVLRIDVHRPDVTEDVLCAIDRAIPFPLVFELSHEGRVRTIAAPKLPNQSDTSRWRMGDYIGGPWKPENSPRTALPVALSLTALYEHILTALLRTHVQEALRAAGLQDLLPQAGEAGDASTEEATTALPLDMVADRTQAIRQALREIDRLQKQLARTKQFNRRVEVNARLRDARKQLRDLVQHI